MIKFFLIAFLFSFQAFAGLPPTTTTGQTDAGVPSVTFSKVYPNDTVYHNGPTATITRNGRPTKNYIQYADFENGATTGWTLGTVGTLTNGLPTGSPTFGSGADANLSISTVSSSQLAGSYSLSYSEAASHVTVAGNMVASSSYAIDAADQAKVLTVKFYYSVPSGASQMNFSGTSSNSMAWALWDVANSVWLSSAGNFCTTQSTGVGYCTGTAQTGSSTANIRLVLYNANATTVSTVASTIYLDDFYLGPQTAPSGPAMTDWVAYTPTFTGFGTVSSVNFKSRRVGANLQVMGVFATGTTTATTAQVSFGFNGGNSNVVADTTVVPAGATIGVITQSASSSTYFGSYVLAPATSQSYVNFGQQTATNPATSAINANNWGSSTSIEMFFEVPIVGWSSNSSMSSDTDTRVVAMKAHATTGASMGTLSTTPTNIIWNTTDSDTAGGLNGATGVYTIPVTGYYDIAAQMWANGTASPYASYSLYLYNVTTSSIITQSQAGTGPTGSNAQTYNVPLAVKSVFLTANTQIVIQGYVGGTISSPVYFTLPAGNYFSVSRQSGPAVITAVESVNARYYGSSTTISGSLATVTYATKEFDSHSEYNSGTYTLPISGKFQINAGVNTSGTFALGGQLQLVILKNGTAHTRTLVTAGGAETTMSAQVSDLLQGNAGDTITIQLSSGATTPAIAASNLDNYFAITRVGN